MTRAILPAQRVRGRFGRKGPRPWSGTDVEAMLAAIRQTPEPPTTEGITLETYPTPGLTAIDETSGSAVWRVASSNHSNGSIAALAGNTYTTIRDVLLAVDAIRLGAGGFDVAIRMPNHPCKITQNNTIYFQAPGTGILIGADLVNGRPVTQFKPISSHNGFAVAVIDSTDTSQWQSFHGFFQKLRVGLFNDEEPADPTATTHIGDNGFRHSGGVMTIRDCEVFGYKTGDGLSSNAGGYYAPRYSKVLVYDTVIEWCGDSALRHNIYCHELNLFRFVRSASLRSRAGHAIKLDNADFEIVDSFASNLHPEKPSWGAGFSSPGNYTRTQRGFTYNSVFEIEETRAYAIGGAARKSTWGGWSRRVPPPFLLSTIQMQEENYLDWELGTPNHSLNMAAQIDDEQPLGAGTTVFQVRRVARMGTRYPGGAGLPSADWSPIDTGVTYDIRTVGPGGVLQEFTGASIIAQTSVEVTFDLSGATPSAAPAEGLRVFGVVFFKPTAQAWDTPILNPVWFNRADPDYYPAAISDEQGSIDHSRYDLLDQQFFEDSMILVGNGASSALSRLKASFCMFTSDADASASMVGPPMNRPQGATAEWPDVAGASEWGEVVYVVNGSEQILGQPGSEDDHLDPAPAYVRNLGVVPRAGTSPSATNVSRFEQAAYGADYGPTPILMRVEANGSLSQLAADAPAGCIGLVVSGTHSAGATVLNVTDATGVQVGHKLQVRFPFARKTAHPMQSTLVDSVNGNAITIADALVRDLDGGEEAAAFAAAGARPTWWAAGFGI